MVIRRQYTGARFLPLHSATIRRHDPEFVTTNTADHPLILFCVLFSTVFCLAMLMLKLDLGKACRYCTIILLLIKHHPYYQICNRQCLKQCLTSIQASKNSVKRQPTSRSTQSYSVVPTRRSRPRSFTERSLMTMSLFFHLIISSRSHPFCWP